MTCWSTWAGFVCDVAVASGILIGNACFEGLKKNVGSYLPLLTLLNCPGFDLSLLFYCTKLEEKALEVVLSP